MPTKKKRMIAAQAAAREPLPELPQELLDELAQGPITPGEAQDLMRAFNKAVIKQAMDVEMRESQIFCGRGSLPSFNP